MFEDIKKKALRITEALYRTTDLFSDAEPLKWSLRQVGLDILHSVSSMESFSYEKIRENIKIEAMVKNLVLKLELAASGTFISKINFDVLKKEYAKLLSDISTIKDNYQSILDNLISDNVSDKVLAVKEPKALEHSEQDGDQNIVQLASVQYDPTTPRASTILNTLKEKGSQGASVGDLAKTLSIGGINISEKTVQRELGSMVASGAVKQEGEKRWRRYFIG